MNIFSKVAQVFLLCLVFSFSYAQVVPDSRLLSNNSKQQLELIQENNPVVILYMNFYLDNSYYITSLPMDKTSNLEDISIIKNKESGQTIDIEFLSKNSSEFNINNYDFKRYHNKPSYYKIGKTGKVFVIRSGDQINMMFNKYRETANI